jgi:aldehyde:ferredoxin oxidoreductase
MRPELPALAPEQPVILAIGGLSTVFPVITKVVAMFISPLTGELGESYAGGRLAASIMGAGYDAIVMTGKAPKPVYLSIDSKDVKFKDARPLWGSEKENTGRIIREEEPSNNKKRSIIRIGKGGENQVSYACVTVDKYRHFGRLGLGAAFGSKHLKAINITAGNDIPIGNFKEYFKVYREFLEICTKPGGLMSKYHDMGTPVNVIPLNVQGSLPTLNLKQNTFEHAEKISGEVFSAEHQVRKVSCAGCPVGCIHIGQLRREFAEKGYEYETFPVAYDFELIFALGTFVGLDNPQDILELIETVEIVGLDAMSTGVILGWATEALEKGLVTLEDTIVPLKFGDVHGYVKAVHYIGNLENEFYKNLAKGSKHAGEVYGGYDFAMQLGGNEMAGYHTGYGIVAGMAVGARHSHLCNAGYSIDQGLEKGSEVDVDAMVEALLKEEVERCMLNSLVICLFSRRVYTRENIMKAFAAIGEPITDEEITAVAKRNYATKLRIKKAFGFDIKNIKLPKRFFETPSGFGVLDEDKAYEIINKYRERIAGMEEIE